MRTAQTIPWPTTRVPERAARYRARTRSTSPSEPNTPASPPGCLYADHDAVDHPKRVPHDLDLVRCVHDLLPTPSQGPRRNLPSAPLRIASPVRVPVKCGKGQAVHEACHAHRPHSPIRPGTLSGAEPQRLKRPRRSPLPAFPVGVGRLARRDRERLSPSKDQLLQPCLRSPRCRRLWRHRSERRRQGHHSSCRALPSCRGRRCRRPGCRCGSGRTARYR